MPTWSSTADVAARLAYGTIGATSSPSSTEVDGFLDVAEAQVRQTLLTLGLNSTLAASSDELLVARAAVVDYAVAEVLAAWGVQRPELLDAARVRRERWDRYIESLRVRPTSLGGELTASGDTPDSAARFRASFTDLDTTEVPQRIQMAKEYD